MKEVKPAFEVIAQWAWAKVNLENKIGDPDAIREYRRALRQKKTMDDDERASGSWDKPEDVDAQTTFSL